MEKKINIDDLITHTMPLADINKGFDLMHAGESIRGVVVYRADPILGSSSQRRPGPRFQPLLRFADGSRPSGAAIAQRCGPRLSPTPRGHGCSPARHGHGGVAVAG
jgi:hypothetical protein